jgi:hypothetical protein
MRVVSRKEAQAAGLRHYFTGVPCVNGHVERRLTVQRHCLGCARDRQAAKREEAPEVERATKARYYRRHKPKVIAAVKRYARNHVEQRLATYRRYHARKKAAHA